MLPSTWSAPGNSSSERQFVYTRRSSSQTYPHSRGVRLDRERSVPLLGVPEVVVCRGLMSYRQVNKLLLARERKATHLTLPCTMSIVILRRGPLDITLPNITCAILNPVERHKVWILLNHVKNVARPRRQNWCAPVLGARARSGPA